MKILALDIGAMLGWAVGSADDVRHGVEDLQPGRFEGAGMRLLRLDQFLDRIHAKHCLTMVVFEEVRNHSSHVKGRFVMNTAAAHAYGNYTGHVMWWCEKNLVPFTSVPVGTWKKALTGSGNAGKPEVQAHCHRLGFSTKTFDESDALGMLLWAEREFGEKAA